jgi:hypothetical protein
LNQGWEEFPLHPTSGTEVFPDREFPARVRRSRRSQDLGRMIAVFLEGKAVIEAQLFLAEKQA